MRKQVSKGSAIVRQILDYARVSETHPQPVEMGALVKETLRLLSVSIRENIAVRVEVAPGEHWVVADPVKLDLVMPRMGGAELVDALRARGYAGPVLYMTGYPSAPAGGGAGPALAPDSWLQKPVTMEGLARAVERVLSRAGDA